jgi:hypothetical protein
MNGDMMAMRRRAIAQYSARMKSETRMKREWDFMAAAIALDSEQSGGAALDEEGGGSVPASELFIPHETVTVSSQNATLLAVKRSVLRRCFSQVMLMMLMMVVVVFMVVVMMVMTMIQSCPYSSPAPPPSPSTTSGIAQALSYHAIGHTAVLDDRYKPRIKLFTTINNKRCIALHSKAKSFHNFLRTL